MKAVLSLSTPLRRFFPLLFVLSVWISWASAGDSAPSAESAPPATVGKEAQAALGEFQARAGVCAVLGRPAGGATFVTDLARATRFLVYFQSPDREEVTAVRREAEKLGLLCTRVFAYRGAWTSLQLADDMASVVWVTPAAAGEGGVSKDEVTRVLHPAATAVWALGKGVEKTSKPFPEGIDPWSHHYHGPDNSTASDDTVARVPFLTQFIASPRYAAQLKVVVGAGGVVYMATGHIVPERREEGTECRLYAFNGYSGAVMWQRPLTVGNDVDRSTIIATAGALYLADEKSCKVIDPATGAVRDEIVPPAELTGGTHWKWMGLKDGVLYALVGPEEPRDKVIHAAWTWGEIRPAYQTKYVMGFAKTLVAIDLETKNVLWSHTEGIEMDARGICMKGERLYAASFAGCRSSEQMKFIVCLNARTGEKLWRIDPSTDPETFKTIGGYQRKHSQHVGWKTGVFVRCDDERLYLGGNAVYDLTALSGADGKLLWQHKTGQGPRMVIRQDGLYVQGLNEHRGLAQLDPATGEAIKTYVLSKYCCVRLTSSVDSLWCRAAGGTARFDLAEKKSRFIAPMRPPCTPGVIPSDGMLYWMPNTCGCPFQMAATIGARPRGDILSRADEPGEARLEKDAEGVGDAAAGLSVGETDWPAYRANNRRTATTSASIPAAVAERWRAGAEVAFDPTAPVIAGGMVFLGGSDGTVRALSLETGALAWKAYTGGPVRYPPAIADGKAFVGSYDGWMYALDAATGTEVWRFRAEPVPRKIPVFETLASTWPVAAGVIVEKGVAYFAAGINNYDGTHVYALDVGTGKVLWHNGTSGLDGNGASVQGEMLLLEDTLYVASGNTASAAKYNIGNGSGGAGSRNSGNKKRGRELVLKEDGTGVRSTGQPFYNTLEFPVYRPDKPNQSKVLSWESQTVQAANAKVTLVPDKPLDTFPIDVAWTLAAEGLWKHPLQGHPVRWGIAVGPRGQTVITFLGGDVLCVGAAE